MKRGIYIIANEPIKKALALLQSICLYEPHPPGVIIPYGDNYQAVVMFLKAKFGS